MGTAVGTPTELDDRELLARHRAGDEEAFAELFRRYYPSVLRYVKCRFHDPHQAEEITQEAFFRAYGTLHRLGPPYRVEPWLRKTALYTGLNLHRKNARVRPLARIDAGSAPSADVEVTRGIDRAYVRTALGHLRQRHREILVLQVCEELSYDQLAERMGTTVSTVQPLLQRARAALRREYLAITETGPVLGLVSGFAGIPAMWRRFRDRILQVANSVPDLGAPMAGVVMSVAAAVTPFAASQTVVLRSVVPEEVSARQERSSDWAAYRASGGLAAWSGGTGSTTGARTGEQDGNTAKKITVADAATVVTDGPGDPEWERERDRIRQMPIYVGHGDVGVGVEPGTPDGTREYGERTAEETASGEGGVWGWDEIVRMREE